MNYKKLLLIAFAIISLAMLALPLITEEGKTDNKVASNSSIDTVIETAAPAVQKTNGSGPGFEAVFAITGLLAVAFLVLRQRK